MTTKQRASLRGLAMKLEPIAQIGKLGLTDAVVMSVNEMLFSRELVKISVLQSCSEEPKAIAEELSKKLFAECVSVIGRKIVLYKLSEKEGIKHVAL